MRELSIFNSVDVFDPQVIKETMFEDRKYGGLLTVTQSGSGKPLIEALKLAYRSNQTCFNLVNVESSPITQTIEEVQKELTAEKAVKKKAANVLYDASDSDDDEGEKFIEKNIGIY